MKTFYKLSDLKNYIKLAILGTYGKGLTYNDILIDLQSVTKHRLQELSAFITIRETGTQGIFAYKSIAEQEYTRWHNCIGIIEIRINQNKYELIFHKK